ncbi:MAG TPA: DUF6519 domain-containing protein [Candidatus Polarisedimenticolia bacterium]|jgi:hypothetical protein|nr:DUF6519 domain-containing protein [Candidatus Polarisedimenticolia bacterium]
MPSDRERLSFDEKQQYRSVAAQQGRVTVPADFNEAQEILSEETRREALDFVGPVGTPDDGYRVDFTAPLDSFDFRIKAGTMYVGGIRVELPGDVLYSGQPDGVGLPRSLPATMPAAPEYIYLDLEEREVSAVEDSSLRDIALGGPDTTQRGRIVQRIERRALSAGVTKCDAALSAQKTVWNGEGLGFDEKTRRLLPFARLQVGFTAQQSGTSHCDPEPTAGVLSAENQLIRVRVSGPGKVLWGFDNASFLYRVEVVGGTNDKKLKLQSPPPDEHRQPRKDQAVEVLAAEIKLANGEYVAAASGHLTTLASAYDPTTQTVELTSAPDAEILSRGKATRLYLRIWEAELSFTAGSAVTLGDTGLTVTLTTTTANGSFNSGASWAFAVRPAVEATAAVVYPARYLDGPQPPDAPRRWACSLAVISWSGTPTSPLGKVAHDCREKFDDLVELTKRKPSGGAGCCTVVVRPEDLTADKTLQSIIDGLPENVPATVCLLPGQYRLPASLVLNSTRSRLTIEACSGGVELSAADENGDFTQGLIVIMGAEKVTLRRLDLRLGDCPLVTSIDRMWLGLRDTFMPLLFLGDPVENAFSACIGVRAVESADLTVEDCRFTFPESLNPDPTFTAKFGAGILATGGVRKMSVLRCLFENQGSGPIEMSSDQFQFKVFLGILIAQSVSARSFNIDAASNLFDLSGEFRRTSADSLLVRDNRFSKLSAAVLVHAEGDDIRVEDNSVVDSYSGFWFNSPLSAFSFTATKDRLRTFIQPDAFLSDPMVILGTTLGRSYPEPRNAPPASNVDVLGGNLNEIPIDTSSLVPKRLIGLWNILRSLEETGAQSPGSVRMGVHLVNNRISSVGAVSLESGPGVLLWNQDVAAERSVTFNSNYVRNASGVFPTVLMLLPGHCVITSNVVINNATGQKRFSVVVLPDMAPAPQNLVLMGNLLRGPFAPDERPTGIPVPTNFWNPLNAVIT